MEKLVDTSQSISKGGRANRYWHDKKNHAYAGESELLNNRDLKKMLKDYSFRGFEFGIYMNVEDRNDRIDGFIKSCYTLSKIVKCQNLGFNERLAISFGARGQGGAAAAHYEPDHNIININKKTLCALAHEYGHALDYNIGAYIDQDRTYYSLTGGNSISKKIEPKGGILRIISNHIVNVAVNNPNYTKWANGYWIRRTEIFARMFEQYVALRSKENYKRFLCMYYSEYCRNKYYCPQSYFEEKIAPLFVKFFKEYEKYNIGGSDNKKVAASKH